MEFNQLHFSHPEWLWGIAAIPLVWLAYFLLFKPMHAVQHLNKFIDSHLLPYLLVNKQPGKRSGWKTLLLWSVVWTCLVLAFAGPRWSFREIEMLSKDQSLVILLDLSESMNATDIRPSRLVRAKQKIEDLINHSEGVNLGLVAFAADPHMITPITEDKETIRHLLPTLETDLVHIQGSKLTPALEMASVMLDAEPGTNKAILVISDGDYEDGSTIALAKKLADKGIVIHAMGIGTTEGTILLDKKGNSLKKNGAPILSKLLKKKMEDISSIGNGSYFEGRYAGNDEKVILQNLETRAESITAGKTKRLWEEHFYLLIIPVLPIFLWWFRRGTVLSMVFILLIPAYGLHAGIEEDYFMNSEEIGERAINDGDYEKAAAAFQDPYRKGVALYKSGLFAEAEKMFKQSSRLDVAADAGYNTGNCLVQQQKYKDAIKAYERVLKQWPEHEKARENLALVKKMLEEQEKNKDKSKQDNSDKQDKKDKNEKSDQSQDQNRDSEDSQEDQEQDQREDQDQESSQPENSEQQDSNETDSDKSDNGNEDRNKNDSADQEQPENDRDESDDEPDSDQDHQEATEGEPDEDEGEGNDSEGLNTEEAEKQEIAENGGGKDDKEQKSQADQDADLWLNRITNDPKTFMKNKFYIESKQSGTKEGIDPW